jgi:hypothetical protein
MVTVILGLLEAIMYCGIVKPLPIMLGEAQVSLLGQARQHTQHIGQGARPFQFEKKLMCKKIVLVSLLQM